MSNNPLPTQTDEYRELSSDLRGKERVLTAIFTAWWGVNGIMIAWLVTVETLSAIMLILLGLFGVMMNFALSFHVQAITRRYGEQAEKLRAIQGQAGLFTPTPYRWWGCLSIRKIYSFIGILTPICWFGIFIWGLVLAFRCGP